MRRWLKELDRLLRGELTSAEDLRTGRIAVSIRTLVVVSLVLGAAYGFCMGFYRISLGLDWGGAQLLLTMAKVPLLFVLTLFVTLPSLYVFSALFNSKLGLTDTVRLLTASVAVNMAILASFGPVTLFFTFCTESYPFMKVLNVFLFTVSGAIALGFLYKALRIVFEPLEVAVTTPAKEVPAGGEADEQPAHASSESRRVDSKSAPSERSAQPPAAHDGRVKGVFAIWLVIYAVVGAQMGWILRPFLGAPGLEFQPFRSRESSFFEDILRSISQLLQ